MVGVGTRCNSDGAKVRIRILPLPSDTVAQENLMKNKEHRVVTVTTNKSGSKQVITESVDTPSFGEQKESVIYVKECMKSLPDTHTDGSSLSCEDQTRNAPVTALPDSNILGEIIIQEALRLMAKGRSTPQILTLTFGQKQCGSDEASKAQRGETTGSVESQHPSAETDQEIDDIPWSLDAVADNDDASDDSLPDEYEQDEVSNDLLFTLEQNAVGSHCISLRSSDTDLWSEMLQTWTVTGKHHIEGTIEGKSLIAGVEKSTTLEEKINTTEDATQREVQDTRKKNSDDLTLEEVASKESSDTYGLQTSKTKAVDSGTVIQQTQAKAVDSETVIQQTQVKAVDSGSVIQQTQAKAMDSPAAVDNGEDASRDSEIDDTKMARETKVDVRDNSETLTFTARDIQECKPELLSYIQVCMQCHPVYLIFMFREHFSPYSDI